MKGFLSCILVFGLLLCCSSLMGCDTAHGHTVYWMAPTVTYTTWTTPEVSFASVGSSAYLLPYRQLRVHDRLHRRNTIHAVRSLAPTTYWLAPGGASYGSVGSLAPPPE